MKFNEAEFWIQVHNIPIVCMNRETGSFIGKKIEALREIDLEATGDCLGKYKKLPDHCFHCGKVGHLFWECPRQSSSSMKKDQNFGPYMEQRPQAAAPSEQPYSAMPVPNDTKGSEVATNLVVEQVSASVHGLDPSAMLLSFDKGKGVALSSSDKSSVHSSMDTTPPIRKPSWKRHARKSNDSRFVEMEDLSSHKKATSFGDELGLTKKKKNKNYIGRSGWSPDPPDSMSILVWNVQGLGNTRTFQTLQFYLRQHSPTLVFFIETLSTHDSLERLLVLFGFSSKLVINRVGRSGGLCLFWSDSVEVDLITFSRHHIDTKIKSHGGFIWRFTGFYGHPEGSQRQHSWTLLRLVGQTQKIVVRLSSGPGLVWRIALCVWLFPLSYGNVRCRSKSASLMPFFVKMKSYGDSVLVLLGWPAVIKIPRSAIRFWVFLILLGSRSLVQMIWSAADFCAVTNKVEAKVSPEMNHVLDAKFSTVEVYAALKQMHPSKVPVLIPKVPQAQHMMDFRAISLCNVIYKIIPKTLTNRLRLVIGQVISDSQILKSLYFSNCDFLQAKSSELGFHPVGFESDASSVISSILSRDPPLSEVGLVISDILALVSSFSVSHISFAPRLVFLFRIFWLGLKRINLVRWIRFVPILVCSLIIFLYIIPS
ncbi:hypothetical protein ACOSQ4_003323 [Xanthoceras sorbifolium]